MRPDNWENPYPSKPSFVAQREAYEAGADAISFVIAGKLQSILDNNDSDQTKLNAIFDLMEALRCGTGN